MLLTYAGGERAEAIEDAAEEAARDPWTVEAALALSEQLPGWARSCKLAFETTEDARTAYNLVEVARAETMALAAAVRGSARFLATRDVQHLVRRLRRAWRLRREDVAVAFEQKVEVTAEEAEDKVAETSADGGDDAAKDDGSERTTDAEDEGDGVNAKARRAATLLGACLRRKASVEEAIRDTLRDDDFAAACLQIFGRRPFEATADQLKRVQRKDARQPSLFGMAPREVGRRSVHAREALRCALLWSHGWTEEWLDSVRACRRIGISAPPGAPQLRLLACAADPAMAAIAHVSRRELLLLPSPLAADDAWAYDLQDSKLVAMLPRRTIDADGRARIVYDPMHADPALALVAECKKRALQLAEAIRVKATATVGELTNLWSLDEDLEQLASAVRAVDEAIKQDVRTEPLWILPAWPRDDDDLTGLLEFVQEGRLAVGELTEAAASNEIFRARAAGGEAALPRPAEGDARRGGSAASAAAAEAGPRRKTKVHSQDLRQAETTPNTSKARRKTEVRPREPSMSVEAAPSEGSEARRAALKAEAKSTPRSKSKSEPQAAQRAVEAEADDGGVRGTNALNF